MTVCYPPWSPTASWLWCLGTICTISYSVLSLKLSPIQNINNSNTSVPYFPLWKYLSHRNSVSGTFQVNVGPSVLDNTTNIKVSIYRAPKSAQAREGLHFPLFWYKSYSGQPLDEEISLFLAGGETQPERSVHRWTTHKHPCHHWFPPRSLSVLLQ